MPFCRKFEKRSIDSILWSVSKIIFDYQFLDKYEEIDFEFGASTEIHGACAVDYQGQFYMLGGKTETRQAF